MILPRPSLRSFSALGVLLGLTAFASRLSAADYYVDYAGGSDNNNGTSVATPWQHCPGDPAATVVPASASLAAGDTVYFKGGSTYVFTGPTGIALRWNGTSAGQITYDGNSSGAWGTGRATFTDNYGGNGIAAFSAPGAAAYLTFRSLDLGALGGAAALPPDNGKAVAARFGAGLLFNSGVTHTTIDGCVFHDLGYWFNQKPMDAAAVTGTGIGFSSCDTVTLSNCDFSHVAAAIEMLGATSVANLTISNCTFHDSVVWTIDMPSSLTPTNLSISGCSESSNPQFTPANWSGYGYSPRVEVQHAAAGGSVTFTVTAAASPAASFQWLKNGISLSGATSAKLTLIGLTTNDNATYTVVATNSAGSSSSNEAILVVDTATSTTPPVFTTQPVSQTIQAGSSVTFTVAASGSPTPTYQWQKNGATLPGATNATLTLASVGSGDAGDYTALATNTAGAATSSAATLTVTSATPTATVPMITLQPAASQTVMAGSSVSFLVAASGYPAPTLQWRKDGVAIAGATTGMLTLASASPSDGGTYSAVATNASGSATSSDAVLIVNSPPSITSQPQSQSVSSKSSVTFTVAATGSPAPSFQWNKDGAPITGATATSFSLRNVSKGSAGTYTVTVSNPAGSVVSDGAVLTVTNTSGPKSSHLSTGTFAAMSLSLTEVPLTQTVTSGMTAQFNVSANSTSTLNYQWAKDDVAIAGATHRTLLLPDVQPDEMGAYSVTVNDAFGSITTDAANLIVTSSSSTAPRLANLSVRSTAGAGSRTMIVGFVVSGGASKSLLVRGVGPGLAGFGVPATLSSPVLSLYSGSSLLGTNHGWSSAADSAQISMASNRVGAFRLADGSSDSAMLPTLSPGAYTAQVAGSNGAPGTALVELYDPAPGDASRLINVSVRTAVESGGDAPIIGFVVTGSAPKQLLIRAVGPSLASFGVDGVLADPRIEIYQGTTRGQQNDDWAGDLALTTAFKRVGAFPLASADSKDAAMLLTAEPGAYTAVVSSANGVGGVVMVEVYEIP